jgi:soluble lytic murein transglycosylase-like protein
MDRDTTLGVTFFLIATLGVPLAGAALVVVDGGMPRGLRPVLARVHGVLEERGLENVEEHAELIRSAAREMDVPRHLLGGVMFAESRGRSGQTSSAGALGLMQLVPAAARDAAERVGLALPEDDEALGQLLLHDDLLNVRLGAVHLRWLFDHRGDWDDEAVLVSYNAGRTKLFRWIRDHGSYEEWVRSEEAAAARGARTTGSLAYARQVLRARDELLARGVL